MNLICLKKYIKKKKKNDAGIFSDLILFAKLILLQNHILTIFANLNIDVVCLCVPVFFFIFAF